MASANLTAARLRELLHYDPDTGLFTWRLSRRRARAGNVAGTIVTRGYIMIRIDGVKRLAHRLAWLYTYGDWPSGSIDHIDGQPANNRLLNLRDVDSSINNQNRRSASAQNVSGYLGVETNGSKFRARIEIAGQRIAIGSFAEPEDASAAYIEAKRRLHPGCTI